MCDFAVTLLLGTDRFTHNIMDYVTGDWLIIELFQGKWNAFNKYG